ncbi:hypothetical protein M5G07_09715 [Serratia symbiotica]|nr:hypothetical protein [Serratia symbiotica]
MGQMGGMYSGQIRMIDTEAGVGVRILGGLDNAGGAVRSNGDQQITTASIDNRQGVFSSRSGPMLTAAQLDNTNGTLISQGTAIYRIEMLDNPIIEQSAQRQRGADA